MTAIVRCESCNGKVLDSDRACPFCGFNTEPSWATRPVASG